MNNNNVTTDNLNDLYRDIVGSRGLIAFTKVVRKSDGSFNNSVKVKRTALEALFSNKKVWTEEKTGNGHAKYTCKIIPGYHVGFPAHGNEEIYGDVLESILVNVQNIVNAAGNNVFKIQTWKKAPDFFEAAKTHRRLYPDLKVPNTNSNSN